MGAKLAAYEALIPNHPILGGLYHQGLEDRRLPSPAMGDDGDAFATDGVAMVRWRPADAIPAFPGSPYVKGDYRVMADRWVKLNDAARGGTHKHRVVVWQDLESQAKLACQQHNQAKGTARAHAKVWKAKRKKAVSAAQRAAQKGYKVRAADAERSRWDSYSAPMWDIDAPDVPGRKPEPPIYAEMVVGPLRIDAQRVLAVLAAMRRQWNYGKRNGHANVKGVFRPAVVAYATVTRTWLALSSGLYVQANIMGMWDR